LVLGTPKQPTNPTDAQEAQEMICSCDHVTTYTDTHTHTHRHRHMYICPFAVKLFAFQGVVSNAAPVPVFDVQRTRRVVHEERSAQNGIVSQPRDYVLFSLFSLLPNSVVVILLRITLCLAKLPTTSDISSSTSAPTFLACALLCWK